LRFWPKPKPRRGIRRLLFGARPFVFGGLLLLIWPTLDPALVEPPAFLATDPEPISAHFTRCGPGRGHACVIDGDTFKIGQRKVRIIGIDAPEVHARCPTEARLAEQATARLQALLNQGPFEMVGRFDEMTDRYGRDLRLVRRKRPGRQLPIGRRRHARERPGQAVSRRVQERLVLSAPTPPAGR
jgi:hypothetical protein